MKPVTIASSVRISVKAMPMNMVVCSWPRSSGWRAMASAVLPTMMPMPIINASPISQVCAGTVGRAITPPLAALTPGEPVVLVGSSLGGFVAARAAEMAAALPATEAPRITGLFLLCPAFDLPGYPLDRPEQPLRGSAVQLVHGRHDDIVPLETSLRAGADWRGTVTVVEDDHPLHASVAVICNQLRHFLNSLCAD